MAENGYTCGVSVSDEGCLVLTQGNLPNTVFNELRKSEELVDVRLEVGNKQLAAHRVVLAATIPYFRTMFTIEMRERSNEVIKIKANIDESSFESIIDYAYGEDILITSLNVKSFLVASSFFQMDRVSQACCEFVQNTLNIHNVLEMRALGDALGYSSLADSAQSFFLKHFEEFAKSESFLSLTSDEVIEIISKNELNVTNEEKVFEAVIKWVKVNENTRKDSLPQLLSHVRLPLLTPEYLTDCVAIEQLVRNSNTCRDLFEEARTYHLLPQRRHLLQSVITTPRSACGGLIYVVGGGNDSRSSVNTVEVYNCELNTWTMEEAMTSSRSGLGVAVLDCKLFAIGGYDKNGEEYFSTVEVFDLRAKRWSNVTPMNYRRRYFGVATLNDKLYVCGGYDGASRFNTVECYDHKKDEWQMMPYMSRKRDGVAVVAFQESIVVLGGDSGGATDLVERFDPQSNRWTVLPSMKTKRDALGAAVLGNKIYVCGGRNGSNILRHAEVFDAQRNEWSFIASMNIKRKGVSLVAKGGKLYAFGGHNGSSCLSSVEMYNPESNEWSFVAPMSLPRSFVGSVIL